MTLLHTQQTWKCL